MVSPAIADEGASESDRPTPTDQELPTEETADRDSLDQESASPTPANVSGQADPSIPPSSPSADDTATTQPATQPADSSDDQAAGEVPEAAAEVTTATEAETSVTPKSPSAAEDATPKRSPRIIRANCGPILLQRIFEKHGIETTVKQLVERTNTRAGLTSLYEMKRVAEEHGLYAQGVRTSLDTLEQLMRQDAEVVCHYTNNNHYIWVESIDDQRVIYLDPAWIEINGGRKALRRDRFSEQWKGICLIISQQPLAGIEAVNASTSNHDGTEEGDLR